MSEIRPYESRDGLGDFPSDLRVVGTDDAGDILAVDGAGVVWCVAHGRGHWDSRTKAFASEAQFRAFVASQHELVDPDDSESREELEQRRGRIRKLMRSQRGAPYLKEAGRAVIADIDDRIKELRRAASSRGRSVEDRHRLGEICDRKLKEVGAGEDWMVRPHASKKKALMVVGPFDENWTPEAVVDLLQPLVGGCELICWVPPKPADG